MKWYKPTWWVGTFLLFLVLSFYPLILCLMKNWRSSELSRFRGNNYQSGDLCFSSPADKHPVPWGGVRKWYSFKWVKFHCFLRLTPPLFPQRFISQSATTFFCFDGGKKSRETIKNMKSQSSQNIRHHKTTLSYDWIYQNWQVKVGCWVSADWTILHWENTPHACFYSALDPTAQTYS